MCRASRMPDCVPLAWLPRACWWVGWLVGWRVLVDDVKEGSGGCWKGLRMLCLHSFISSPSSLLFLPVSFIQSPFLHLFTTASSPPSLHSFISSPSLLLFLPSRALSPPPAAR
ncbi:hypothetical protein Pmani_037140 [Petrolisthes manimaculis]|uniref:Uncharacterized protein n=1 Tax=Petrolisthes manimaculis TaxID=1843537 RepID=A0AAE1TLQ8_9EUCA|nr:hypothetical protein Pmani_037140 [Petrolisthes manimaculis]